jgi:hypothetical protein
MSEQKLNIYPGKEKVFEKELKLLNKAKLSPRNNELITRYHNYLFSTGSGAQRVSTLSCQLRSACGKYGRARPE